MKWVVVTDGNGMPIGFKLCAVNHSEHKLAYVSHYGE